MEDWKDTRSQPPPDDHTAIELRFGSDPIPFVTFGVVFHRARAIFGPSPVPVRWRLLSKLQ